MSDNITLPGTGGVVATDDIGSSVQVQYMKLMDGTGAGIEVIPGTTANGLDVDVTRLPSMVAGEAHIGEIGGRLISGSAEFTNTSGSSTAYSIGDTVSGSANVTTPYAIPNVFRIAGGSGYIVGLTVSTNKASIVPVFRVHFYSASSVTITGDNLPYSDTYADTALKLGIFDLPPMISSVNVSGSCSLAWDSTTIRQPVIASVGSTSLWVALETRTAFTPAVSSEKYAINVIVDNN
jgi:hypothetical protein